MVPSITMEVANQLKSLKPGNAIAFGSAFKVPINMQFQKADPEPLSNNVDIKNICIKLIKHFSNSKKYDSIIYS